METLKLVLTQFTDEAITISAMVLLLIGILSVAYWIYNRRKFRSLAHQIPASVVKNYLDSIIQNSTALKSSLFRGGGLELGDGIPSVLPTSNLPSTGVGVANSSEELNQKNAEIASLQSRLSDKDKMIADLEAKLKDSASAPAPAADNSGEVVALKAENTELRDLLEKAQKDLEVAQAAGGGDDALQVKLKEVSKECDELKERLMEYEIIEEDLANLKRLQEENDKLKKQLAEGGGAAAAPEPEPAAEAAPEPEPAAEAAPEPEPVAEPEPEPAAEAAPEPAAEGEPEVPQNEGEQKSAEELLSEFEKMLG